MNLCGGITQISEQDLDFPTEEFNVTPRKARKPSTERRSSQDDDARASRSSSRGRDKILAAVKVTSTTQSGKSGMLNPVSRDDVAKLRSRMKSSSILMKKLESGFNVVRMNCFLLHFSYRLSLAVS